MAFNSYFDFQLGDKYLSDFGGVLHNGDGVTKVNLLPALNKQVEEFSMIDGAIYYGGGYEPRNIKLSVFIDNKDFNQEEFSGWIKSKKSQWFNYVGDDKKIMVVYDSGLDMDVYNIRHGFIELNFIAYDPYWYLIDDVIFEKDYPSLNTSYQFINLGNEHSFPLIKFTCGSPSQTVVFELNGKQYQIADLIGDIYVDFYTETVYAMTSTKIKVSRLYNFKCLNGVYRYEFGYLPIGINTLKITSGIVENVVINCNSRYI